MCNNKRCLCGQTHRPKRFGVSGDYAKGGTLGAQERAVEEAMEGTTEESCPLRKGHKEDGWDFG